MSIRYLSKPSSPRGANSFKQQTHTHSQSQYYSSSSLEKKTAKLEEKHLQSFLYKSGRVKYSQLRNEKHVTKTSSAIQWHFVEREVNKIQKNLALIRITLDH